MEEMQENLYQKIIQIYHETDSVKETAKKLGTYPIKVRRILITEGLWHSNKYSDCFSICRWIIRC